MKKLYEEKLLDPDVFILSAEEYGTYIRDNLVGVGDDTTPYTYVENYAERYGVPHIDAGFPFADDELLIEVCDGSKGSADTQYLHD